MGDAFASAHFPWQFCVEEEQHEERQITCWQGKSEQSRVEWKCIVTFMHQSTPRRFDTHVEQELFFSWRSLVRGR